MGWANILVVDDNEDICDMVEMTLKVKYTIFKAFDGITATRILDREKIDMVITDLVMPGVNGLSLTEKLKTDEKYKDILVIMMTATTAGEELADSFWKMAAGTDGFLTKPFHPAKLFEMVDKLFEEKVIEKKKKSDS
jgi:CheY-like chemotaxis protein